MLAMARGGRGIVVPYSREHIHSVVADVRRYREFVPHCVESTVLSRQHDGMVARLGVGFRALPPISYISRVKLGEDTIVAESHDTGLFKVLRSKWHFKDASTFPERKTRETSCEVKFEIMFEFDNPLYNHMSSVFLKEVVKETIAAFETRCAKVKVK
eukprot:g1034.t1